MNKLAIPSMAMINIPGIGYCRNSPIVQSGANSKRIHELMNTTNTISMHTCWGIDIPLRFFLGAIARVCLTHQKRKLQNLGGFVMYSLVEVDIDSGLPRRWVWASPVIQAKALLREFREMLKSFNRMDSNHARAMIPTHATASKSSIICMALISLILLFSMISIVWRACINLLVLITPPLCFRLNPLLWMNSLSKMSPTCVVISNPGAGCCLDRIISDCYIYSSSEYWNS